MIVYFKVKDGSRNGHSTLSYEVEAGKDGIVEIAYLMSFLEDIEFVFQ